ncbi:hypothetical protein [Goodfellowiella coeruleoviolacea]|uniref:Uncharacterized protein n=1 Tax=Goodfellowiella coeruleoviolacea TaxID=334858 RepID=A0AAE3KNN9_9PSEU|nr:hypothetical protein [Goodfellowiella coeruleoviolacea]MCP2168878.1 hypothetical protein [Goodfellowiella coeruleoviolacea]
MNIQFERRPDGGVSVNVDTSANPQARVVYDLLRDSEQRLDLLALGAEEARHPELTTTDDYPFWSGNETVAQVLPEHVVIENLWTEEKLFLSHADYIAFVEGYLTALAPEQASGPA